MKKLFLLFVAGSLCVVVKSQTYLQPTTGQQNTYEGACMVTTGSGTSYDNGGAGGNYAANINNIYRTFCPSAPGMAVRITFTSFSMNDTYFLCFGPNSCCDYITILDGPTPNSPVLYSNCTSSPGTITATNPTGCLTIRQVTDGSVQLGGWAATITNVPLAGGPTATTNTDCSRAISVCSGSFAGPASAQGPGFDSESCAGCGMSETYSLWYKIGITSSGTLAFNLDPNNNAMDFDFSLYGPNVACGALGTPIRCSAAAAAGNGTTGMGNGAVDASEDVAGDQWVSQLNVTAGQTYYLLVKQWTSNTGGFAFNFTGTAGIGGTITTSAASLTNVACFGGSTGAASIVPPSGGTGTYTYDWAPGNPTGDGTLAASGLTAGTWSCTVTDAAGCTAMQVFSITQPATALTVSALSQTNVACFGGSNGAAAINTPTGGAGGYTFNWTPGNPAGDGTTSVSGLTSQTYTCTVTDISGCTGSQAFNITAPTAIVVTPLSQTNNSCNGGSSGAATINTPTGGAGGYTYNWTPGNPTGDGTVSVSGLTTQVYTCTITDANLCVATQTFNITAPTAIAVTPSSQTNISCNGGSDGAASINTPTGGAGGYTYNWTPGNPTGDGTISVSGLTAQVYTCTITDANLCVATQTFSITAPGALSASSSSGVITCNGGSTTVTVTGTGGTAPYTGTGTFTVTAGTYTYTVTDANGCANPTVINVTEPATLTASSSASSIACNGGSATVTVSGAGGTAPYSGTGNFVVTAGTYTYTVTDANGCTNPTVITVTEPSVLTASSSATSIACNGGSATVTVSGAGGTAPYSGTGNFVVTAGTYTYTVTDANGCTNPTVITVTEPSVLTASSSATSIACNGGSATVTVSGSGGTAPYSGTGNFVVTAGTYTYTVTDANGCTNPTVITVTEPSVLTASSSATAIACNGGNSTVTVSGSGGTAPYTGTGNFVVTAGTYTFTVTDANGCTSPTVVTVTEPSSLSASSSSTSIACNGGNATITVIAAGGTAPYTGDGTFIVTAGIHSYTVTDANGCTAITSITVTEPTAISTIITSVNVLCNGDATGSIDLAVSGGTGAYTFDWNSGTYTTEDIMNLTAGTYSGLITDANGCTDGGTVIITEPPVLIASVNSATDPTTCAGLDGAIDISVSGGVTNYGFLWNTTAVTEDLSGIGAGAYSCIVTDANGCTTTAGANLNDPNSPMVTLTIPTDTICSTDGPLVLSGESPSGGTFSGPGVTAGSFDPAVAGVGVHTISYTFTDAFGCTASVSDSMIVDVCLGTDVVSAQSDISILPNPNNGTFILEVGVTSDVMIYDAVGKLVYNQKVRPHEQNQILLSEPGVYMVTAITADGQTTSKRIIVLR